jgi:hypothetical protein
LVLDVPESPQTHQTLLQDGNRGLVLKIFKILVVTVMFVTTVHTNVFLLVLQVEEFLYKIVLIPVSLPPTNVTPQLTNVIKFNRVMELIYQVVKLNVNPPQQEQQVLQALQVQQEQLALLAPLGLILLLPDMNVMH